MAKKQKSAVASPTKERPIQDKPEKAPAAIGGRERAQAFLTCHSKAIFVVLVAIASIRIISTYWVFNHTIDEPAHIACGMEWLDKHVYRYEPQHPPLSRVMAALGPYLSGEHSWGKKGIYNEGAAILYARNHYDRVLALARLGILPFFWLGCVVIYWWTRRSFGEPAAFFATFFFTFLPPILAHAGLATTDMALTATFGAAFLAMLLWLERPSWTRSAWFGVALAAAILSKFSVFAFFPSAVLAAFIVYCVLERPTFGSLIEIAKPRILPLGLAALVTVILVWAGYRFSFNGVPAPELWQGIRDVMEHNAKGHPGYLLGEYRETGWWYYYPVVLAVKTPLALLALFVVGAMLCWKRRRDANGVYWIPAAFVAGILIFAAFSRINIGVRHVLPVYFGISIIAALGACQLWSSKSAAAHWTLAGLMLWMVATSVLAHPDYLPYFNAIAGNQPEKILVDSDLDWGQDMKRLSARLREVGAQEVYFNPFISAFLEAVHGFPPIHPLDPQEPSPGWNAVSLTPLKLDRLGLKRTYLDFKLWPDEIPPRERVGKSVLLYYFPPK